MQPVYSSLSDFGHVGIVEDASEELLDVAGLLDDADPSGAPNLDEILYLSNIRAWRDRASRRHMNAGQY